MATASDRPSLNFYAECKNFTLSGLSTPGHVRAAAPKSRYASQDPETRGSDLWRVLAQYGDRARAATLGAVRSRPRDRLMLKFACPIAATLLVAASAFADARKPFVGICEGVVQLGFFIDGTVSVPVGKTHHERSIGRYKCTFTDPEISTACPNGATCRVMALMRGGNQFQILSVFGVAKVSETPSISPLRKPKFGP
jgi:hypothetical protein